uniref:HDC19520 n=1 Tax=Drosophila melanogaster TaxID=7227 RepID=Q6II80_DROME|nr:TPA_inf: HDC19520 [Drosophila melanogaster]
MPPMCPGPRSRPSSSNNRIVLCSPPSVQQTDTLFRRLPFAIRFLSIRLRQFHPRAESAVFCFSVCSLGKLAPESLGRPLIGCSCRGARDM